MAENLFETRYDLTKKSKIKEFYNKNKILIFTFIFLLTITFFGFLYYQESNENKKILLSDKYIQAKVYLDKEEKLKASQILKEVIFANDSTYSTLSFFMILNENLIEDSGEVSKLFDHLLKNNKYEKEVKNLLIYKKALYKSDFVKESKLLNEIKPLLNDKESIWRVYALLLLADFYFEKKNYMKAKNLYKEILLIKNLRSNFYKEAQSKLSSIADD